VSEKIGQLKLKAIDGKMRLTDCANTEALLPNLNQGTMADFEIHKEI